MSVSDGLSPSIFSRKLEKARPMREWMDGKVFFPARVGIFNFDVITLKVLSAICTLIWRVKNYVSRREKVLIGEMKVQIWNCLET